MLDIINTLLQCIIFINTINYCTDKVYQKSKSERFFYIILLFIIILITTFILGNSSIATFLLHFLMLIIGGVIYKKDLLSASIAFSLVYSFIVVTIIISSCIYNLFFQNMDNSMFYVMIITYIPQYILAYIVLKKQNVIYLLFRTIKSRNNSIIYLIIFSVILDFIVSFNVIIHDKDNPLFKQLVLILLFTFLIFITIYFWNIDKKSKEIDALNLALKDNIDLLKKVKHDYGAQISYLYGLHLMKKYDRLGELLKNIIDGHNSVPSEIVVSNTDSILTDIVNSIDLKGINVFIDENADFSETSINELDLQRIISNIVKNSVTALGDHGLGLISITTFYSLNQLVIKIKNNGPKIEPEVLEKIFDTGFTTKKNQNKNNGFGLSIVKELVESYDGRVFVNSDNLSTEFTINIPINK